MTAYIPQVPSRTRTRLQITLLALLFGLPFVGGYVAFYFFPQVMPQGRVNYGQLVKPTRPLPVVALRDETGKPLADDLLRGKWTLLHIVRSNCDEPCLREVILSRQTRQAMNRDDGRVRRLLLAAPGVDLAAIKAAFGTEQPDLHYAQEAASEPYALPVFAGVPDNAILVIDPIGNWLMSYPPAADAVQVQKDFRGIQKDLRKLLKLSHIG